MGCNVCRNPVDAPRASSPRVFRARGLAPSLVSQTTLQGGTKLQLPRTKEPPPLPLLPTRTQYSEGQLQKKAKLVWGGDSDGTMVERHCLSTNRFTTILSPPRDTGAARSALGSGRPTMLHLHICFSPPVSAEIEGIWADVCDIGGMSCAGVHLQLNSPSIPNFMEEDEIGLSFCFSAPPVSPPLSLSPPPPLPFLLVGGEIATSLPCLPGLARMCSLSQLSLSFGSTGVERG